MEHKPLNFEKMDRTVGGITTFEELEEETRAFWHSRTPEERLRTLEWLWQGAYAGYDSTTRLQRVLTVVKRSSC
jgi:hypothetical protein